MGPADTQLTITAGRRRSLRDQARPPRRRRQSSYVPSPRRVASPAGRNAAHRPRLVSCLRPLHSPPLPPVRTSVRPVLKVLARTPINIRHIIETLGMRPNQLDTSLSADTVAWRARMGAFWGRYVALAVFQRVSRRHRYTSVHDARSLGAPASHL